jgi:conjugative relaxase-like TrwC/TraI family protein
MGGAGSRRRPLAALARRPGEGVGNVLTISSGHSADYLTGAVAAGRENYYTGAVAAGEPPGRWYGAGAAALGLSDLVDHQDMTALYEHFVDPRDEAFSDPSRWTEASTLGHAGRRYLSEDELYAAALDAEPDAGPERRAELRLEAGKKARRNVSFLDATYSVQKSVTVLHTAFEAQEVAAIRAGDEKAAAAWGAHRQAVEDAIWAGNRAALDYLAEHAGYSRVGHHGGAAGRFIDAHDWTVASFFQHDSRDHDPQLHIHNAILNRVQGSDGEWRTLDSRAIHRFRGAASAVAERTTEEHLTRALGVRFATRPDGKAREVVGVPAEVMDLFSSRRRAITAKTQRLVSAFEAKFARAPNSLELDRLQRQATFATRQAKSHGGETVEQRLERWDRELRAEVAGGLATVARDVLNLAAEPVEPERWSRTAVVETALADVQSKKSAWTAPDLTRAISDALPDHLGNLDGQDVARLLRGLTSEALALAVPLDVARPGTGELPAALRLDNGQSAYEAPAGRLYATPEHLHTERLLAASTVRRGAPALDRAAADRFVTGLAELGIELGVDQAAAVRGVLTSGAAVESLVGPAGTGKSFVVGALAKAWQDPSLWDGARRRVVGLAASQIATEVLAGEGLDARNVARWLATQQRLADRRSGGDDEAWRLRHGDLVVVDESAMANTADLAAIQHRAEAAGAKLLLTGDHRQLAAVGAGGAMDLMSDAGASYELAEVRRFTAPWERDASLRLRGADETVLDEYHKHGRLLDGGTIDQAETSAGRAWLADTLAGRHSLLLVDTNEQAARLSAQLRAELVRLGRVEENGVPLGLQGTYAGVGDLVQARLNGWHLAGYEGNRRCPINRETYRVLATREDGGLVVAPVTGGELAEPMTLPGEYVVEHVALGYASTVHAAQGLTVDTCHAVVTSNTGPEALYVGMSRVRHANTAHVTTLAVPSDAPIGAVQDAVHRHPAAVLAATLESADPQRSALAEATESAAAAASVRTAAELLADAAELATAGRTARWLDQLVDAGHLTPDQRAAICRRGRRPHPVPPAAPRRTRRA